MTDDEPDELREMLEFFVGENTTVRSRADCPCPCHEVILPHLILCPSCNQEHGG